MGQIGQVFFKRLGRTVMEETIGQWSQQSDLSLVARGWGLKGSWIEAR